MIDMTKSDVCGCRVTLAEFGAQFGMPAEMAAARATREGVQVEADWKGEASIAVTDAGRLHAKLTAELAETSRREWAERSRRDDEARQNVDKRQAIFQEAMQRHKHLGTAEARDRARDAVLEAERRGDVRRPEDVVA